MNLDHTLFRPGTPFPPPQTPHITEPWGDTKLSRDFHGLVGVLLPALCFSLAEALSSGPRKRLKLQLPPCPADGQYPPLSKGGDISLSPWLAILLEIEFLILSNRLLQKHYNT